MKICEQLNDVLPRRYVAVPNVHLGAFVEVDVATFERDNHSGNGSEQTPNVSTDSTQAALWSPPEATAVLESELESPAEYEVRIYDVERNRSLVAAIELISPANKDRPEHRRAFVAKCVGMLWKGIALILVDPITVRQSNLYREIWQEVGGKTPAIGDLDTYAVSIKPNVINGKLRLETWERGMDVGKPLPTLPLWLTHQLSIQLKLEDSYESTCRALRIA